jgi:hypothetical protein
MGLGGDAEDDSLVFSAKRRSSQFAAKHVHSAKRLLPVLLPKPGFEGSNPSLSARTKSTTYRLEATAEVFYCQPTARTRRKCLEMAAFPRGATGSVRLPLLECAHLRRSRMPQ